MVFDSFEACVEAAMLLHDRIGDVTSSTTFDSRPANWYWTVLLDGNPVAVCVHDYRRRVECLRALAQFLVAARTTAKVADELRHYGPTALRAYDHPRGDLAADDLVSLAAQQPIGAETAPGVAT